MWKLVVFSLNFAASICGAAHILFLPSPLPESRSILAPWANKLAQHGHDVTIVAPFVGESKYKVARCKVLSVDITQQEGMSEGTYGETVFRTIMETSKLTFDNIAKMDWEIIILDIHESNIYGKLLAQQTEANVLAYSLTATNYEWILTRSESFLSLPVLNLLYNYVQHMNPRKQSVFKFVADEYSEAFKSIKQTQLVRQYYSSADPIDKFYSKMDVLFVNSMPQIEFHGSVITDLVYVGGMHLSKPSALEEEWRNIMLQYKQCILVDIDWDELPSNSKNDLLRGLEALPSSVAVIIGGNVSSAKENLIIRSFMPKEALLLHAKGCKVLVTKTDAMSVMDAIYATVPVVAVPANKEQQLNADKLISSKVAIQLDTMEPIGIKRLLMKALDDVKMKRNIEVLKEAVVDQIQTPLEKAVFHTEFALRHPSAGLVQAKQELARHELLKYYGVDLLIIVGLVFYCVVSVTSLILRFLFVCCCGTKKAKTD